VIAGVPAVYDRLRKAVAVKVSGSAVAQQLFKVAFAWKRAAIEKHGISAVKSSVWDPLLFDKVRTQVLGGCVRMMISGGGPLSPDTQRWIQTVFCCPLTQGYGLTETMGCATVGWIGDARLGVVGPPNPANLIKLWPTDDYKPWSDAPPVRGEVCISGPCVAKGYFRLPEQTREAFRTHADGRLWFHTGDVGEWTEDGCLKITDRVKDLVKLAGGEYVSLGKLEREIRALTLVDNACVHANATENALVAIVVPNAAGVRAELRLADAVSLEEMAERADVRDAVRKAILATCKKNGMKAWEVPRDVVLARQLWTPDNGMLTAAMKVRRTFVYKHFERELADAYLRSRAQAAE
jgi:long-chain acyl-CoA synthetase